MVRVLIVDDHHAFRAAIRLLLERGGLDVVTDVADGAAAVEAAEAYRPDLVLLDVQLPGPDGFEICERILDAAARASVPAPTVVLTSGRTVAQFRHRLADSRATAFIPKDELTAAALVALAPAR